MALEEVYSRNLHHRTHRMGWLRAAVLGANDGLIANSSLIIGVEAARAHSLPIIGLAGIVAGASSMAIGEYISVKSQSDIENSDRELEIQHLAVDPEGELLELAQIYIERGLSKELAMQVAQEFHKNDPLEHHLRDELGQFELTKANPIQAALASAISFTIGGVVPVIGSLMVSAKAVWIIIFTMIGLAATGYISGRTSGAKLWKSISRTLLLGGIGMGITALVGSFFHISL